VQLCISKLKLSAMRVSATSQTNITYELLHAVAPGKVCNPDYLNGITRGNKTAAGNLAAVFFTEINEELAHLQIALEKSNYTAISNIAHKMKSAFAILGISILAPVIHEMEHLSTKASSIEIISQLIQRIQLVFNQAKVEMKF
jgi:HPt (histidine-containing phosphotransfer) domain-containing protein